MPYETKPQNIALDIGHETLEILDFVIPMSLIGLVYDANSCILENLSMVMDNLIAYNITQNDIFETLLKPKTIQEIRNIVIKSIVPDMVNHGFSHLSY